jgi:hypothetical protein
MTLKILPKRMPRLRRILPSACLGLLLLLSVPTARPYSVLTHEAIVDSVWDTSIKALLLQRFPNATPEQLTEAHAYAYGGSIIQDLGYYPFSSKFFSDLTHYARSGDFILSMIRNSQDINEYAFSLGALAHYASDNDGHRMATNLSVPLLYPKLRLKFGNRITYADDPFSHLKTEFGFDVYQAARGRYAPDGYKSFIGFQVSKPAIERAFEDTYGVKIEQVFSNFDLAVGSYRRTVGSILPAMTRIAWQIKKQEIQKDAPGITKRKFLYNLSRSSYEKNWGTVYPRPGIRSRIVAFLFRIVPRVGPFKFLAFKRLTPETEKLFMTSFNAAIDRYRELLSQLKAGHLELPNENLDTGGPTEAGQYKLADAAYAKLVDKLADHYQQVSPELRGDILAYYHNLDAPISTKTSETEWAKLLKELDALKAVDPHVSADEPGPVKSVPVNSIGLSGPTKGQ